MGILEFDKFLEEVKSRPDVEKIHDFTPAVSSEELYACDNCGNLFKGFGNKNEHCEGENNV